MPVPTAPKSVADKFGQYWQTKLVNKLHNAKPTIAPAPHPYHGAGSNQFPLKLMWMTVFIIPSFPIFSLHLSLYWYPVSLILLGLPAFSAFVFYTSRFSSPPYQADIPLPGKPIDFYVEFRDADLEAKYSQKTLKSSFTSKRASAKIPFEELIEGYFDEKLDFKDDALQTMESRYDFASFQHTSAQFKFFLTQWVPETLWHSRHQDEDQVREHYDRGNSFYASFLGPSMLYTTGLISKPEERESLEQLQANKLHYVCDRLKLQPNDRHLDIGCGWGTLLIHSAKYFGTVGTGVTLAAEQIAFGRYRAEEHDVSDRVNLLHLDYRDIPIQKFDKISCLEMSEHVGVRLFPQFMKQVYNMLEDDGIFFLQIAGLRRRWTYEDLIWGLFMAKYVFPGADASCPLNWIINQLECAGFEVREVQTVGVHYSATIERWYYNWKANRVAMTQAYGERWVRVWEVFLAWSAIISRQGSATCYQIVAHKNLNKFNRVNVMRGVDQATTSIFH